MFVVCTFQGSILIHSLPRTSEVFCPVINIIVKHLYLNFFSYVLASSLVLAIVMLDLTKTQAFKEFPIPSQIHLFLLFCLAFPPRVVIKQQSTNIQHPLRPKLISKKVK